LSEFSPEADGSEVAYFSRRGDRLYANPIARGGWGTTMSGHVVGGLLAWAVERFVGDSSFQPARLTVDLCRPASLAAAVDLEVRSLRDGKRLRLAEAVMRADGHVAARASALFLRRGEQPAGVVPSPGIQMPPIPNTRMSGASLFLRTYGWGAPIQNPEPGWTGESDLKYTWLQLTQPLFDDEPLTAFTCAAMAGDVSSSLANWGSQGLQFINADYTLTLSRLPDGPTIGLASQSHCSHDGVATGSARVFDSQGEIGSCVSVAVAQAGFRPPTAE
jgi:acyl-CoA thioesterase